MYKLNLTQDDWDAISFVGGRYGWSDWLIKNCEEGLNEIPEHKAWEFKECSEDDGVLFTMLDTRSDLFVKLINFHLDIT